MVKKISLKDDNNVSNYDVLPKVFNFVNRGLFEIDIIVKMNELSELGGLKLNPLDPNPAISAHAVFPQSGHIRPEKRPFFQDFPHFSKLEPAKKY